MNTRDIFYSDLVKILNSNSLSDILGWMSVHSQSLILNYGEDNQLWECAWIVDSGNRFVGFHKEPIQAIKTILNEVRTEILTQFKAKELAELSRQK